MNPKFKFNVPENYGIDLTIEPEEEGIVYSGPHGIVEFAFANFEEETIEESVRGFLEDLDVPYTMLSEMEKVTVAGLEGLECRYEVEGDYYYELELGITVPDAYEEVNCLSVILRAESKEELAALEKDLNVPAIIKVL